MSRRYNEDFTSLDGRRAVMSRLTPLGAGRRGTRLEVRQRTRRSTTRRDRSQFQSRGGNPARADTQHSNRICVDIRSHRRGLRRELRPSRWQRYRIYQFRLLDDRKVGGVAQGDCPADHAHCLPRQPPSGRRCLIVFPAPNRRRCLNPKSESRYGVGS